MNGAMNRAAYPNEMLLRDARERYLKLSGIDEPHDVPWVTLKTPLVNLKMPNAKGRIQVVRLHDLHHIATGYPTTWRGEGAIGAWEIASGCERYFWAWALNFGAFCLGMLLAPKATARAFFSGKRSKNLYQLEPGYHDGLLAESVGHLRSRLGLAHGEQKPRVSDVAQLALWCALGAVLYVILPVLGLIAACRVFLD